jgi:O-antigen ligase
MTRAIRPLWTIAAALWIAACVALGGTSVGGAIGNAALQFGAVVIILAVLWRMPERPFARAEIVLLALFGALVVWLALTAIPLPPEMWTALPGRAPVAEGYRLLGAPLPWLPIALEPDRLPRSALGLLPVLATFLLVRGLDEGEQRIATLALVGVAIVSLILGGLQMAGGQDSPLRLYEITTRNAPVGFFANGNHLGTLLLVALPFAAGALHQRTRDRKSDKRRGFSVAFAVIALALSLGLLSARSMAGVVLLIPALIGSVAVYTADGSSALRGRRLAAVAVGGVALGLAAFALLSSPAIQAKFRDNTPGSRGVATPTTLAAAQDFLPIGSGLGSFVQVYGGYEPADLVTNVWMNHAHNDYAEAFLELGLPGALLIGGFLLWFLFFAYVAWTDERCSNANARAASVAILLLLAHSAVDYPLRTGAMSMVFALSCALLVAQCRTGIRLFPTRAKVAK